MKPLLHALQFLAVFPVPVRGPETPADYGRMLPFFPAAGLLLGLMAAGLAWAGAGLPGPLLAVLLAGWSTVSTGALHLDGLADTCDGLCGHHPRDRALEIMRDSRIGVMGAAAVALSLLLRVAACRVLAGPGLWETLVLAPVASRWAMALACTRFPGARTDGKAAPFIASARRLPVLASGLCMLPPAALLFHGHGLWMAAAGLAAGELLLRYASKRLGGVTGDVIGAAGETVELTVLTLAAAWGRHA